MIHATSAKPNARPVAPSAAAAAAHDAPPSVAPVEAVRHVDAPRTVQVEINTDAPLLPDSDSAKAKAREVYRLVYNDGDEVPLNNRAMAWMALQLMSEHVLRQFEQASRLKRLAEDRRLSLKGEEIHAAQDRIEGDRTKTRNLLGSSLVAACTAAGMGYFGNLMAFSSDGTQMAQGQAMAGASQTVGGLLNSLGQAADKVAGGARMSDDADIRSRRLSRNSDIAQQKADAARNVVENARQAWQKAQQGIRDFEDRRNQAISGIYR